MASNTLGLLDRGPARTVDPDRSELRVVVSGDGKRPVLHATGAMSEPGARLVMALVEQSVRNGCAYLRLDLAGVTAIDMACLRVLRRFQAKLQAIGVTLRFTDPHRRTTQVGLLSSQLAGSAVLA